MKEANAMLWVVTTKLQQNEIKLLKKTNENSTSNSKHCIMSRPKKKKKTKEETIILENILCLTQKTSS